MNITFQTDGKSWPFQEQVVPGRRVINPQPSMPAEQLQRSVDTWPPNKASGGGATSITYYPPFWLYSTSTSTVQVKAGTVNGVQATSTNTDFTLTGTNTHLFYLKADLTTTGTVTTATVLTTTATIPADTSSIAYTTIGTAVTSSSTITQVNPMLAWSQTFVACGRDSANPTSTPGTYYWVVS